jgi:hypothetical protein
MWGELVGEGFYEPIDDMGPDRTPSAPKAVQLLTRNFEKSGYDVKWLFETICTTEAYQRQSRPRREPNGVPFTATVAQPLRSDQLFNAILSALDSPEPESQNRRGRPEAGNPYRPGASVRGQFEVAFGFDPSDPRETVNASIPQALALMNGVRVNMAVRAIGQETMLGRLLEETPDNKAVVEELYLRTLSREPSEKEMASAIGYCDSTKNRAAVFEDLLWALVNSSEFSHRR